jgi:hypothetical protein
MRLSYYVEVVALECRIDLKSEWVIYRLGLYM